MTELQQVIDEALTKHDYSFPDDFTRTHLEAWMDSHCFMDEWVDIADTIIINLKFDPEALEKHSWDRLAELACK